MASDHGRIADKDQLPGWWIEEQFVRIIGKNFSDDRLPDDRTYCIGRFGRDKFAGFVLYVTVIFVRCFPAMIRV
jgi:hypothetical protein